MKILIATPLYPPDIGGPATYAKILEGELPKNSISVKVISYGAVRRLPKIFGYPLYALNVLMKARNADIVLALDPMHTGLSGWLAATLWKKKFITRIVGDYAWEQGKQRFGVKENLDEFVKKSSNEFSLPVRILRCVQTFVAKRSDRIIVPSKYLKGIILSWGIPEEKITVVYNAFEEPPRLPPREELRKNFGFTGPIIFSAGRLVPWKGFETLMNVMVEIRKKFPDAKLYIAGSGPWKLTLTNHIISLHLENTVMMLGDVARLKLMEYISAADCFVLNTGYEGLSHQLLEVLAVGTPIVATNVGGNPELIQDQKTGFLVPYGGNLALLRDAIIKILSDKNIAEKFSENGKVFVAQFTVPRMIDQTKKLFETIFPTV